MDKTKNGIEYSYIVSKLLLEQPDVTPRKFELLMEMMDDFDLLSKQGQEVYKILCNHVYQD